MSKALMLFALVTGGAAGATPTRPPIYLSTDCEADGTCAPGPGRADQLASQTPLERRALAEGSDVEHVRRAVIAKVRAGDRFHRPGKRLTLTQRREIRRLLALTFDHPSPVRTALGRWLAERSARTPAVAGDVLDGDGTSFARPDVGEYMGVLADATLRTLNHALTARAAGDERPGAAGLALGGASLLAGAASLGIYFANERRERRPDLPPPLGVPQAVRAVAEVKLARTLRRLFWSKLNAFAIRTNTPLDLVMTVPGLDVLVLPMVMAQTQVLLLRAADDLSLESTCARFLAGVRSRP